MSSVSIHSQYKHLSATIPDYKERIKVLRELVQVAFDKQSSLKLI